MRKYEFQELIGDKNNELTEVFDQTIHINLCAETPAKREKGVDTLMFECENGATLIIEKDCASGKTIGIEIFK